MGYEKDLFTVDSSTYEYQDKLAQPNFLSKVFGESIFGWTAERERRNSAPPEMVIMKPSLLSPKVVHDALTFRWLTYLDDDKNAGVDFTDQYINEYSNIGLLSALVFTVWVAFQTQPLNFDPNFSSDEVTYYQTLYAVVWTLASVSVLAATIISVLFILAFNESSEASESDHFVRLFDGHTFGYGSLIPLVLLYSSMFEGITGMIIWYYINYQSRRIAWIVAITTIGIGAVFTYVTLQLTSCLYSARHADMAISALPKVKLSIQEIQTLYDLYVQSVNGEHFIESEDKFIDFVRVNAGQSGYKCKLSTLTDAIARKYFAKKIDSYIEQALEQIEDLTPEEKQKRIEDAKISGSIGTSVNKTDGGHEIYHRKEKTPTVRSNRVAPSSNRSDVAQQFSFAPDK